MKKVLIVSLFILGICLGGFYFQKEIIGSVLQKEPVVEEESDSEPVAEKTETEINKEIVHEKIVKIKKRLALKGLITEGDEYFRNDQLTEALKSYLQAFKRNPDDEQIVEKLGDTYMEMNKFKAAQKYYQRITDYPNFDKNTLALSYLYSADLSGTGSIEKFISQIKEIELSEQEVFYHATSSLCLLDFHECKKQFDDYRSEVLENGDIVSREIQSENLKEILTAIENYRNFQVDQVYFKDALIVGALYKNKNYPIAIDLGKKLLLEKTDYRPIMKILADSYYELGDFENAKLYLSDFYKLDTTDPGVAYLLGVIHGEEGDQVLSNIYLNKALENGYTPSINIRRQLVHNYFTLESQKNIINTFYDLIEKEEDFEKSDLELAIYYYILYEQYDQAKIWIQKGMSLYPTEENFHGYLGWIQKQQGQYDQARQEFKKGLEINAKNPFVIYNIALLEKETGNLGKALIYFKQVKKYAGTSQFGSQAEQQIEELTDKK